ncbi:MAG: HAD family hydrolase [Massilibacteroides sp.]|nr:HAD family hydrolase [Massilibacteroides sp.]MDD3063396.1 HAD family hydrolase [Massilibacteroides sp.]MDD4115285.1 HAD family hydrolase [Massilibacteroides sp.]MDD4661149.1 HAD family hydrolase [Massilibacteroides sp.]
MKRLVIFDLDGTLLNTIADLAASTNYALSQHGFPTHETSSYNFFVGNGINKLFERALPEGEKTEANIRLIRETFLPYYDKHLNDHSRPYPGIPELLAALQQKNILLAVASNKYQAASEQLIRHFFPEIRFTIVLGQREGVPPKPDPTIVREILHHTGIAKEDAIYVGDSGVDMQTILNSKIDGIGVTWGFRPQKELEAYAPKHIVDKAEEILRIL